MALTQVSTGGVKDDAITKAKIPANQIEASELADGAVSNAKIASGAVGTNKLASGAVGSGEIAAGSILNSNISSSAAIAGSKLADNTITTAKVADDAITQAKINVPLTNRNIAVNGAMLVAQRGTTYTGADSYNTVDMFKTIHSGLNEDVTTSQADVSSGTTPYSLGFRKAYKITNGNQSAGAGAGDLLSIQTRIEAQNLASSGWDYKSTSSFITLSFWVKSSVAQSFGCFLRTHDGSQMTFPFETGTLTANTWTKITKTISGNGAIGFSNDNGTGMEINISQFWGSNYTSSSKTLDAWSSYSNDSRLKDFPASTWYTTNDATFELTGVQLEVGSTPTVFEHIPFVDELLKCQRYFVRTDFTSHVTAYFGGSHLFRQIQFVCPTPMRTSPSFSVDGQESGGGTKFTLKTWSSDQNNSTNSAVHLHHTDYVHGTGSGAVHSVGVGIDFLASNSGSPPNGAGNHNVYACRMYGATFSAEL